MSNARGRGIEKQMIRERERDRETEREREKVTQLTEREMMFIAD